MDLQNVKNITIPEGSVKNIHDKNSRLLWGAVGYDTKYAGDTTQAGGPTPDAPQNINVVTGVQNVWVHGKNVCNLNNATINKEPVAAINTITDSNSISVVATGTSGAQYALAKLDYQLDASATYTFTGKAKKIVKGTSGQSYIRVAWRGSNDNGATWGSVNYPYTNTSPVQGTEYSFSIKLTGYSTYEIRFYNNTYAPVTVGETTSYYDMQIELGSATTYEPYQGQNFTIGLGNTELCKIGDHQDKIYKSGDNWYVHKEVGKSTLGTLNWSYSDTGTANVYRMYTGGLSGQYVAPANNASVPEFICTHFTPNNANANYGCAISIASNPSGSAVYCYDPDYNTTSSPADFKIWLSTNSVVLYYALKTTTDTEITDSTLIPQLEAVNGWLTRYGYNATVSGNLPIVIDRTNL